MTQAVLYDSGRLEIPFRLREGRYVPSSIEIRYSFGVNGFDVGARPVDIQYKRVVEYTFRNGNAGDRWTYEQIREDTISTDPEGRTTIRIGLGTQKGHVRQGLSIKDGDTIPPPFVLVDRDGRQAFRYARALKDALRFCSDVTDIYAFSHQDDDTYIYSQIEVVAPRVQLVKIQRILDL